MFFNRNISDPSRLGRFLILLFLLSGLTLGISMSCAYAMGKRPAVKEKEEPVILPEIEIITRPGTNMEILSEEKKSTDNPVTVSPAEVIPAVGIDVSTAAKNIRVVDIQQALTNAGFSPGASDGKIGPKTKKAIKDFQAANSLTIDGVVGEKTWAKLKPYLDNSSGKSEIKD